MLLPETLDWTRNRPPPSAIEGLADGRRAFVEGFVRGARPPERLTSWQWADRYRVMPSEVTARPGRWSTDLVPYLREPLAVLSPWDPTREVYLMKGAQSAGSEGGLNWLFHAIDHAPGPMMIVQPTVDMAKSFSKERIEPSAKATPRIVGKIHVDRSRDGDTTVLFKRFPGGYLILTGANSAAGLRQRAVRYLFGDDLDAFDADVDREGDPWDLAIRRTLTFYNAKILGVSTPTLEGYSRIANRYALSDRRVYQVECPICAEFQRLLWPNLQWPEGNPHAAVYVCVHNGCVIEHRHKRDMVADAAMGGSARWLAEAPGPNKAAGFWINELYSPFSSWGEMASDWVAIDGNPTKLKVFINTRLAETWKVKGDAPPAQMLFDRRESYTPGRIPLGGLFVTCAADVQKDRIEFEVVAWGLRFESWQVEYGVLMGDPADDAVWEELTKVYERSYEDALGNARPIEAFAVDSGYLTNQVYKWVRGKPRALAIKGATSRTAPALGVGTPQEVDIDGRKIKGGILLYQVGGWGLKEEFYRWLAAAPDAEDARLPYGYPHFHEGLDLDWFARLTNERLTLRQRANGAAEPIWLKMGPNEPLDIRVYNRAATIWLGADRLTEDQWEQLRVERTAAPASAQTDMFHPTVAPARSGRSRWMYGDRA